MQDRLKTFDGALGVLQKLLVILGIAISAWYFILREENEPRVRMAVDSAALADCTIQVTLQVENVGRAPWQIGWARAHVAEPDFRTDTGQGETAPRALTAQTRVLNYRLRNGESTQIGFNLRPDAPAGSAALDLVVALQFTQEEGSFRLMQDSVDLADCA